MAKRRFRMRLMAFVLFMGIVIPLLAGQCGGTPTPPTPGFSLSASAVTINLNAAAGDDFDPLALVQTTATSNIAIKRLNGFKGDISLEYLNFPKGAKGVFTPNPVTTDGVSSNLDITLDATATVGKTTVTVKGSSGKKTASTTFVLTVANKADTTAPRVVSASPENNAKGVDQDTNIVITFSEPMNKKSVEDAFYGPKVNTKTVSTNATDTVFGWTNNDTTMTATQAGAFEPSSDSSQVDYVYGLSNNAKDKAGNALNKPLDVKVTANRTYIKKLQSEKELDGFVDGNEAVNDHQYSAAGDNLKNEAIRGFFSFDLSKLSDSDVKKILKAEFRAYQYSHFGEAPYNWRVAIGTQDNSTNNLLLDHVFYGTSLDVADFGIMPLGPNPKSFVFSSSFDIGFKIADVTKWTQEDFARRDTQFNRTQFRIGFEKKTNHNDTWDGVRFANGDYKGSDKTELVITFIAQ